jgi:hypothetical protein
MSQRVLPEAEIESRRKVLEKAVEDAKRVIRDAEIELRLLSHFASRLVPMAIARHLQESAAGLGGADASADESGGGAPGDDGEDASGPTRAILELLGARPGLTREQIYDALRPELDASKASNKRSLVTNTLYRLLNRYGRLEIVGNRYYLRGQAPDATRRFLNELEFGDSYEVPEGST